MTYLTTKQSIPSLLRKFLIFGTKSWWLSFLLWLVMVAGAEAAVQLRVAVKQNVKQVQVGSSTEAIVTDGAGRQLGQINAMNAFNATGTPQGVSLKQWRAGEIVINPQDDGFVWIGDRWYRGKTRLVNQRGSILAINNVDLEDYLYSVVGAEAIPSWPLEALKSQAVAARTYALYLKSKSNSKLFDLDTSTATQVYKGLNSEYSTTHEAVTATSGQIMTYNNVPILAVFHSSSGGHTENVEDVWTQRLAYLRGVTDYDQSAPVYQWNTSLSRNDLSRRISGVGNVKSFIPQKRTPQGRVLSIKVVGDRGAKVVSGSTLRDALNLRSTLFDISASGATFQISGRGFGHGLGLSQWGAYGLAIQGVDYQQILSHFYQNATLSQL
jgi:stage II sporulation protein D